MPVVVARGSSWRGFRSAPRPHLVEACHGCGRALASGGMLVLMRATLTATWSLFAMLARFHILRCLRRLAHPRNLLPDQLLDRSDALAVGGRDDGDRGAASPRAPRAADTVHIILGMVRNATSEATSNVTSFLRN